MDKHFLEFWGNLFLHAAKGQKQVEEIVQWVDQGLKGFEGLTDMFHKSYGLDRLNKGTPEYGKAWREASDTFQNSLRDFLKLMGVVPRQEHLALVKKYEDLKKKAADQEETIKHLRMLLEKEGMDQGEAVKRFQDLVKEQTEQFQDLIKGFGRLFEKSKGGRP
jgi:hypothetical protein